MILRFDFCDKDVEELRHFPCLRDFVVKLLSKLETEDSELSFQKQLPKELISMVGFETYNRNELNLPEMNERGHRFLAAFCAIADS